MDSLYREIKPPFGIKDKLGYLFGDFGNDFTFILSSSFLLKFYTDVMGVAPWVVGLVMTFARFVDGFTDVTMGRIADRSRRTKDGKFKPWIMRMAAPVAISSFLIYQSAFASSASISVNKPTICSRYTDIPHLRSLYTLHFTLYTFAITLL